VKVLTSEKKRENDGYMQLASIGIASMHYIYQLDKGTNWII